MQLLAQTAQQTAVETVNAIKQTPYDVRVYTYDETVKGYTFEVVQETVTETAYRMRMVNRRTKADDLTRMGSYYPVVKYNQFDHVVDPETL